MTVSGRRRTWSVPSFRKVTARAEAVLSDSTLPGWLFSVGWLMVPDVPENEPVTGDSQMAGESHISVGIPSNSVFCSRPGGWWWVEKRGPWWLSLPVEF